MDKIVFELPGHEPVALLRSEVRESVATEINLYSTAKSFWQAFPRNLDLFFACMDDERASNIISQKQSSAVNLLFLKLGSEKMDTGIAQMDQAFFKKISATPEGKLYREFCVSIAKMVREEVEKILSEKDWTDFEA